ncbi:UvrABC system protein A [compost metagenome]
MDRLVDAGNTVVVIEHHMDVVRHADWVIDMGPDGGSRGGQVVFEGPPSQLRDHPHAITGRFLR